MREWEEGSQEEVVQGGADWESYAKRRGRRVVLNIREGKESMRSVGYDVSEYEGGS